MSSTEVTEAKLIEGPSEKDQAIMGWKLQRRRAATERAEQAQRAEAIATGRVCRGGTYRVVLPPEYSVNPESPSAEDAEFVVLPHSGLLAEVVEVTLSREIVTDPRGVWNARRLVTVAMREARGVRRKARATEAEAEDAAAEVIADIMERTRDGMPLLTDVTPQYLAHRAFLKLTEQARATGAETATEDVLTEAEAEAHAEEAEARRAQRDADPMLNDWADPMSREVAEGAEALKLTAAERDALLIDGYGLRPADVARMTGRKAGSVRVTLHKGRAQLAERRTPRELAEAMRQGAAPKQWQEDAEEAHANAQHALRFLSSGPLAEDRMLTADAERRRVRARLARVAAARSDREGARRLLRLTREPLAEGATVAEPIGHTRPIALMPERTEQPTEYPLTHTYLVGRERTEDVLAHIGRHC